MVISSFSSCIDSSYDFFKPLEKSMTYHVCVIDALSRDMSFCKARAEVAAFYKGRILLPGGSVVKKLPANAGDSRDVVSIPGSGRSPGKENDNPLQYSCLGNLTDRGGWQAVVHGIAKSRSQLSD